MPEFEIRRDIPFSEAPPKKFPATKRTVDRTKVDFVVRNDIPMPGSKQTRAQTPKKTTKRKYVKSGLFEKKPAKGDRIIMGFKIKSNQDLNKDEVGGRPFSWKPLFESLRVKDAFDVGKDKVLAMKSAVSKYNKRLKPKQFTFIPNKRTGGGRVGRKA